MALAYVMLAVGWLAVGAQPDFRFFLLTPLFVAEYAIVAHGVPGRWPKVVAYSFIPMWIYGHVLFLVYWRSAWHPTQKKNFTWGGDQGERY